jgi:hypothetical protein
VKETPKADKKRPKTQGRKNEDGIEALLKDGAFLFQQAARPDFATLRRGKRRT